MAKNINEYQLKKCIFYTLDEYEELIKKLLGEDVNVSVEDFTDLYYESTNDEDEGISFDEIKAALEKYFDVEVTSIHTDGCEYTGVWIVYKEHTE